MRFNARLQAAYGVDREVSVDAVLIAPGGGYAWVDADRLVLQRAGDWTLWECHVPTRALAQVQPARGMNLGTGSPGLAAGGGRWAAWLAGYGLYTSDGRRLPDARLLDVGPAGELAYGPDFGTGIGARIEAADGAVLWDDPAAVVADLRCLGGSRAVWRTRGAAIATSFGVQVLDVGDGAYWPTLLDPDGAPSVVYASERGDLRWRPAGSAWGFVLDAATPGRYYDPDAVLRPDGALLVGWCVGQGERLGELRTLAVNLADGTVLERNGQAVAGEALPWRDLAAHGLADVALAPYGRPFLEWYFKALPEDVAVRGLPANAYAVDGADGIGEVRALDGRLLARFAGGGSSDLARDRLAPIRALGGGVPCIAWCEDDPLAPLRWVDRPDVFGLEVYADRGALGTETPERTIAVARARLGEVPATLPVAIIPQRYNRAGRYPGRWLRELALRTADLLRNPRVVAIGRFAWDRPGGTRDWASVLLPVDRAEHAAMAPGLPVMFAEETMRLPITDARVVEWNARHIAVVYDPNPECHVTEFLPSGTAHAADVHVGVWKDEAAWRRGDPPLRRTGKSRVVTFP